MTILRISIADMISLNVRTKGSKNVELPATLYQCMPEKAMGFIATIPCGKFAVSIPGAINPGRGCPILKTAPPDGNGFVIAYERKPNGRYEATSVQYQGRGLKFAEFIQFACRWVEQNMGMPKEISGRYACFSPTREEWGVILRDSGYIAWDPSGMPSTVTPELRACLQPPDSSGILARARVYAGEKQPSAEILPVFARVEVMPDSSPSMERNWLGFAEYQKIRSDRERPPDEILPAFNEWLKLLTKESGFERWVFRPGMLFGDRVEWWGDRCRRRTEHEGVDFATGTLHGGQISNIPEGVPVRCMAEGDVVAVLDDFIGKTVVVRHTEFSCPGGCIFVSFLSHILPQVTRHDRVYKGQIAGFVGKSTNTLAPSHLHLTGAWIPSTLAVDGIRIDHIHPAFEPIVLVNFRDALLSNALCSLESPAAEPA